MEPERYELADVIGSGGMATVWRARDTRLGRVVAIKRPHPSPADSTVLQRFTREARAAATITHPNLVAVYDVGEDDAGPYLVMEYIDGPSLATATVPAGDVAKLGAQVASALAALHDAGVVHGDVKPANILLADSGVKLTDFGIARTSEDTTALTREGIVFATPEYAAPETLAGVERTPAADVYSLGAVLHELLTGSRWMPAAASTQVMPPTPWPAVLAAALAADPARRPSAAILGTQLTGLEIGEPDAATQLLTASPPPPPPSPPPGPPASAMAAAGERRGNARTAVAIFAGSMLLLAAVAGVIALGDDGGLDAVVPATGPTTEGVGSPTTAPSALPPTSSATAPPTTLPPTTAPVTTIRPADAIAGELAALLAQQVAEGMDGNDATRILDRIDEAIVAADAGKTKQVEKALSEAFDDVERHVPEGAREDAVDLVLAVAVELGVDPAQVVESKRPGARGDHGD